MFLTAVKSIPESETEALSEVRSALSEYNRSPACKRLINRISVAQFEYDLKSLVVLSQFSNAEKSIMIASIALGYMCLLKKRVLIVDAISPNAEESFYFQGAFKNQNSNSDEILNHPGCVDVITTNNIGARGNFLSKHGMRSTSSALAASLCEEHVDSDAADFQVMPLVDSMKEYYDLILVDTCALDEVNKRSIDPLILAEYADSTIIFAPQETLERQSLAKLCRDLKRHRIVSLGIVVNTGMHDES